MKLEITRELKNIWEDTNTAKNITKNKFWFWFIDKETNIFSYIWNELVWILDFAKRDDHIHICALYVHDKLRYNPNTKSWYGIGSRILYEMFSNVNHINAISLISTPNAIEFYEIIFWQWASFLNWFHSTDLSQIKKNLEFRLRSPWYLKLTEEDLVRLWIISKNLETVV